MGLRASTRGRPPVGSVDPVYHQPPRAEIGVEAFSDAQANEGDENASLDPATGRAGRVR